MTSPVRIQRSRKRGWKMPPNTVVIDRTSEWGNPYKISPVKDIKTGMTEWWVENRLINGIYMFKTKADAQIGAVELFRHWVEHNARRNYADRARLALRGKNLACWCKEGTPCHADVLLELANAPSGSAR